jgi:hypothetical protein
MPTNIIDERPKTSGQCHPALADVDFVDLMDLMDKVIVHEVHIVHVSIWLAPEKLAWQRQARREPRRLP